MMLLTRSAVAAHGGPGRTMVLPHLWLAAAAASSVRIAGDAMALAASWIPFSVCAYTVTVQWALVSRRVLHEPRNYTSFPGVGVWMHDLVSLRANRRIFPSQFPVPVCKAMPATQ